MNRTGHLGAALLYFTPVAWIFYTINRPTLVIGGYMFMMFTYMLPDMDMKLPFMSHRKTSHSFFAAGVVSVLFGSIGALIHVYTPLIDQIYPHSAIEFIIVLALFGFLSVVFHIFADIYTPMGVPLLRPFKKKHYSLDLFNYDNVIMNSVFFIFGLTGMAGTMGFTIYSMVLL